MEGARGGRKTEESGGIQRKEGDRENTEDRWYVGKNESVRERRRGIEGERKTSERITKRVIGICGAIAGNSECVWERAREIPDESRRWMERERERESEIDEIAGYSGGEREKVGDRERYTEREARGRA